MKLGVILIWYYDYIFKMLLNVTDLSGMRTKFTERIFTREILSDFDEDNGSNSTTLSESLSFLDVLIIVWNFCSLSYAGLARYVFEIFDPEKLGLIEKPDVEAMYRMLFSSNEHDDRLIESIYPFDENENISKTDFMDYSSTKKKVIGKLDGNSTKSRKLLSIGSITYINTDLIEPAIQFQTRMRKLFGGIGAWKTQMAYRERFYSELESECSTLSEAVAAIIKKEFNRRENMNKSANTLLLATKLKIKLEEDKVKAELRERDLQAEQELQILRAEARDTPMNDALAHLEEMKRAFTKVEFTLDDVWKRHEMRLELFDALDMYIHESKEYWDWKYKEDIETMEGTEEDHEYRYQDYAKTADGILLHDYMKLQFVFQRLQDQINAKNNAKKSAATSLKSNHEVAVGNYLSELNKLVGSVTVSDINAMEMKKRMSRLRERSLVEEMKYAKKKGSKGDWVHAEAETHIALSQLVKQRMLVKFYADLEILKEEQRKDYVRKEFELSTTFGSRITKWEYVFDEENDRKVYVSVDTLEQMHMKTAICEKCDETIVQHEMNCTSCGFPRSAKNQKLFRPLGYKDITLE